MANLLTRVYNSTLGVPQQALYRLWRALKEDEIDVFSREGLLAPELLPVLGIAASHETDVDVQELIGDQGFGTNLAADILLDPATYLTAGATGIAKAAKATRTAAGAKKGGREFLDYVGDFNQYDTAGALANKIASGIGEGALKEKGAQVALKNLESVADNPLSDVLKAGRQEESLFTLPGLSFLGARWRAPEYIQNQGSWFKALTNLVYKQKLGLAKPLDYTGAQLANLGRSLGPTASGLTDAVATVIGAPKALVGGLRTPIKAAHATNLEDVTSSAESAMAFVGDQQGFIDVARRVDPDAFQSRYLDELQKPGADQVSAAAAAFRSADGGRLTEKQAFEMMDNLIGEGADLENLGGELSKGIADLQRKADEADLVLDGATSKSVVDPTRVPEEFRDSVIHSALYDSGRWLRGLWRKGFISDAPIENGVLDKHLKERAQRAGMGQASVRAAVPVLHAAKKRVADSSGVPVKQLDQALSQYQQAFPHPSELRANLDAMLGGDLTSAGAAVRNYREYLNRLRASATSFQKITGTKVADDLIDVLGTEGRIIGANVDPMIVKGNQVARPDAVADLIGQSVDGMVPADIKRLRGAVDDPVLKAKLKNLEKRPFDAKARLAKLEPPRRKGKQLTGLSAVAGDFTLAIKDLERAATRARKGEGMQLSPLTVARLQRGEQGIQAALKDMLSEAFPKADAKDIDAILGFQDLAARQAGPFERGAPIAFMQRLNEPGYRSKMAKLVGRAASRVPDVAEVQAMQTRVLERSLTVEDLNLLQDELLKAKAPELWEAVREQVGDIPALRYSESWEADVLNRLSQQSETAAQRKLIDDVFSNPEAAAEDGLMGGRVTRIIQSPARKQSTGVSKRLFGGKKSTNVREVDIQADLTPQFIEIQQADGKFRLIDAEQLEANGVSIQSLGKSGDSLGAAVTRHDGLHGARKASEPIEEGSWLMTGQDSALQMLRQAVIPQKHEMAGALAAYDSVNFMLKKFQTVFRASHHAGNLISNIAQTRAAGASVANTMLAHVDTLRLVSKHTDEGSQLWGDLAARTGVEANSMQVLGKPAQLVDSVEGLLAGKSIDELEEFMVLDNGVQQYGGLQIVERALQRNLYGSVQASEDIRLGGRVGAKEIRQSVERAGGKVETLLSSTRAPEFFARTTTVMALLREGHALDDAVDMAKLAHVDYSDLTKFERHWMKRAVPYYTFSRKYVPFALDKMARDPQLIGAWVKSIQQNDMMGIDENGKPVMSYGKFEADLGRINANVDALMAMAGVTEAITGSVSNDIQSVQGPGFATLSGGAVNVALSTFGAGSDQGMSLPDGVQEAWDSVFVSRFLEAGAAAVRGEGFQPLGDSALSWIIPARFNAEPEKARRFQMNLARRALRRLEMQAQEARTESQRASLRRQAQQIRSAIQQVQEDFGQ